MVLSQQESIVLADSATSVVHTRASTPLANVIDVTSQSPLLLLLVMRGTWRGFPGDDRGSAPLHLAYDAAATSGAKWISWETRFQDGQ